MTRQRCHAPRSAFTIIELIVVVSIIGLLIALLIPAIQAAREASRRVGCLNNLHQIGIGLHGYQSAFGLFPGARNGKDFSPLAQLLPFVDQLALYNTLNLSVSISNPETATLTALNTRVTAFLCPSDSQAWIGGPFTSYAGCEGDGENVQGRTNGFFSDATLRPFTNPENHFSPAAFLDGLSNTAAFSEWLVGSLAMDFPDPTHRRQVYVMDPSQLGLMSNDDFVRACRRLENMPPGESPTKGLPWHTGGIGRSMHNHALTPNDPSCRNQGRSSINLAITAGSLHPGGVNVLMGDGRVNFVADTTTLATWRAMATRAGNDPY